MSEICIQISNDDDGLTPGRLFWKRKQHIHSDKFQRPVRGKRFYVEFSLEAGAASGAVMEVSNCPLHVVGNVLPVDLASHGVAQATLAGVSRQFWIMRKVKESWTKGIWHYGLYRAIDQDDDKCDPMVVI